jgi:membrane protease subunit (stomatin/prohibitin family)
MASKQDELAVAVQAKVAPLFQDLGLVLEALQIQSISLPEDLEERLDERIGMGITGDLGRYAQFQAARSVPIAAAAGGTAGAGVGMGVGVAMGQTMARAVAPAAAAKVVCPACNAGLERASKFCPECGGPLA